MIEIRHILLALAVNRNLLYCIQFLDIFFAAVEPGRPLV